MKYFPEEIEVEFTEEDSEKAKTYDNPQSTINCLAAESFKRYFNPDKVAAGISTVTVSKEDEVVVYLLDEKLSQSIVDFLDGIFTPAKGKCTIYRSPDDLNFT